MTKIWSFLSIQDDDRQFKGNDGYDDVFGIQYSFDQFVPNHRGVRAGHVGVIRDGEFFLGFGKIQTVTETLGTKERHRCPTCGKTGFKERSSVTPRFSCHDCSSEFETPSVETLIDVCLYKVEFGADWTTLKAPVLVKENKDLYLRNANQHAIRQMHAEKWFERVS